MNHLLLFQHDHNVYWQPHSKFQTTQSLWGRKCVCQTLITRTPCLQHSAFTEFIHTHVLEMMCPPLLQSGQLSPSLLSWCRHCSFQTSIFFSFVVNYDIENFTFSYFVLLSNNFPSWCSYKQHEPWLSLPLLGVNNSSFHGFTTGLNYNARAWTQRIDTPV